MARNKNWEDLEFTDDYLFKTIMTKYPRICKKLLETILEIEIRDIRILDAEKAITPQHDSRGIRLDVYVEDDRQTVYTVDMQVRNDGDAVLAKRTRYYQSAMDMDALKRGVKYKELKESFVIFLCPFRFMDGKHHMYTFKNFCQEDKAIQLPDGTTKIIIASKGDGDDVSFELKCLLDYMNTRIVAGDLVTEIADAIKTVKKLEEEAVKYMTWKDLIDEEREEAKEEGRKEGREEGRKEGREEGRKEGREEGRKEGRKEGQKEGRKEGRIQSVRDLIQAGATTFEMVAKSGKYTAEELAAIAAKN